MIGPKVRRLRSERSIGMGWSGSVRARRTKAAWISAVPAPGQRLLHWHSLVVKTTVTLGADGDADMSKTSNRWLVSMAAAFVLTALVGCGAQPGKSTLSWNKGSDPPPLAKAPKDATYALYERK